MARAELNDNREPWEVGQAIVAAWFKVLSNGNGTIGEPERLELLRVFREIFKTKIEQVTVDKADSIYLVIPQPPTTTVQELLDYLNEFHRRSARNFHEELGTALIFGCGK